MRLRSGILFAIACTSIVYAQNRDGRLTLPELAKRSAPQPVFQSRTREIVLQRLESVLPKADMVVHGRVERITSYLSDDKKDIYTDYLIVPLRVMRQRINAGAQHPGVQSPPPILVKRWGGELIIDGVRVTQEDHDVRAFQRGEQLLLLLAYNAKDGKYVLPSAASGAFTVTGERIEPLVAGAEGDEVFETVRRMNLAQFEAEVLRLTR